MTGSAARSVVSYFDAFAPAPEWDQLPQWPPDVFAVANLVLDHTESYRFVIAPPPGQHWPPTRNWNEEVRAAGRAWRDATTGSGELLPELVRREWQLVTRFRDVPLSAVRDGTAWPMCEALLTLHAAADEACDDLTASPSAHPPGSFEAQARAMLESQGSMSRLSPARVRVVPKSQLANRGITIRSLSRYLALCYESVEVQWRRAEPRSSAPPASDRRDYNVLLVPWPASISPRDFRAVSTPLGNMDTKLYGFFEFAPNHPADVTRLSALLRAARRAGNAVDAVVLPECALEPHQVSEVEQILAEEQVTFLVSGVRQPPEASVFGRNYVHVGVLSRAGWERYRQDKHHRWCLDAGQLRQYHLTRVLDPRKLWWESVDIPERTLHILEAEGATVAPLVCEDLARIDEVADLVRRIGPTLVIAVLLDGPQLATRWPCRYAAVLGDEPGSAVLTLTALGMAARSRPSGKRPSRVVALWNDATDGLREIELGRGSDAVLLTISVRGRTAWTADGRSHKDVPTLTLNGIRQLRARDAVSA
jgi:hypothetical protein